MEDLYEKSRTENPITVEKIVEVPVEKIVEKEVEKIVYQNISGEEINATTLDLLDEAILTYFYAPSEKGRQQAIDDHADVMERIKEFRERIPNATN